MDDEEVARRRLAVQRLHGEPFDHAEGVVRALLAVQAQDVEPSEWSIGMRAADATLDSIRAAIDGGALLRTHVLRPTWHLVHRDDLRWLLSLTAPRVHVRNRPRYADLHLDAALLDRAAGIIREAVKGTALSRAEIGEVLTDAGIDGASGQRLAHILMYAELEQVVCSGPRRGTTQTYAALDELAPDAGTFDRDTALRELALRFVTGHGPATRGDLQWWASLTAAAADRALDAAGDVLVRVEGGGRTYHLAPVPEPPAPPRPSVLLLQPYDEYVSGAADSRDVHDPGDLLRAARWPRYSGLVTLDGRLVGSWRRHVRSAHVDIDLAADEAFAGAAGEALERAAWHYATFRERELSRLTVGAP
ncbi:winged helix DNA-binding domain-containing protein [Egibacter rhizosphaerae]|uniref:winged helix DNA-binding domain-containing protein n=1 Tax=Egibacter rhizosphaerae TaxID=1670831 RepID=UPI0013F14C41|nr:winged helix DNA-binding domain-containing protein [Egibacter rhizosphaerae]